MNKRSPSRVRFLKLAAQAGLICAAALSYPAHAQANLDFFSNTAVADLKKEQINSLYAAISASLDAGVSGKTSQWTDGPKPSTTAKITPTFEQSTPPCAKVDLVVSSKRGTEPLKLRYCKNSAGKWALSN
ncbi:hypothetical protein [Herbaspirillum sp. C9C3]|uniref:hypothetical protein n=1 Tax=Herbaspirillum sp. C9C3 TaxID=2735271 RepID=UPI0015850738|nr:hypothetical protein [Herbaspirillum sp. C9C3]NUT60555.1 hypothetical protein [Herbaspirillum sp. C9C3]